MFRLHRRLSVVATLAAGSISLQACTTLPSGNYTTRSSAMDRAIGSCVGSVIVGAGVGALVGAAVGGDRGAGRGALIGAAGGLGRCAVLIELAAQEDREKARRAELDAVRTGSTKSTNIKNRAGKSVAVRTVVKAAPIPQKLQQRPTPAEPKVASVPTPTAPAPKVQYTACRQAESTVSAGGSSASTGSQLWCRTQTGDWEPIKI